MVNKLTGILIGGILSCCALVTQATESCADWPQWHSFKQHFISNAGRVIDIGSKQHITTSEGQSYALFFALVANDRAMFDKLLSWTERHLAEGDLSARLPAWQWGKRTNKSYGILDSNPASDSDLWIAYALAEASQLWQERRYAVLSSVLAARILREETAYLPGLGLSLLPAPFGFELKNNRWRLNPSYVPLFILQRFSSLYNDSPWQDLHQASAKMLLQSAKNGYAPDWVLYSQQQGFHFTRKHQDLGTFNAIRVYLWAGLMAKDAPYRAELITQLMPMLNTIERRGIIPLSTHASRGQPEGQGPIGFSAALLPFLASADASAALAGQSTKVTQYAPKRLTNRYYDSVLTLFGRGALEQRYYFDRQGQLHTKWSEQCP